MGRVRRYKKIKSIDPFSKKQKSEIDTIHDEPPSLFQEREEQQLQNKTKRNQKKLLAEYRRAARETIVIENNNNNNNNNNKLKDEKKIVVEKIRKGETMKDFNKRIRQKTRETLKEEAKKNSSTFQKRKEKLKEKKLAKKAKKRDSELHLKNNEEFERFGASETGHVRPSDLENAKTTFQTTEQIKFGERVDCPPDFRQVFQFAGAKKAGLGTETKKRKRNNTNDEDDEDNNNNNHNQNNSLIGESDDGKNMLKMVMEREKIRVVEAYKALQKKRRDEQGRNFSTLD